MINSRRHTLIATAIITTLALAACGIKGELKTPPPLWGDKAEKVEKPQSEPPKSESNNEAR